MNEKLTPERSVRLLRAKAAELENRVLLIEELREAGSEPVYIAATEFKFLVADIALVAQLLADHIERSPGPSGPELGEMRDWGAGG